MTKPQSGFLPSSILCHSFRSLPFAFLVVSAVAPNGHNGWVRIDGSCPTVLTAGCPDPSLLSLLSHFSSTGEILAHTLKAFMELMEHDFVSWETLSAAFIKKVHNSCAVGCPR